MRRSARFWAWALLGTALAVAGIFGAIPAGNNPAQVSTTGLGSGWQSTQVELITARLASSSVQPAIVVVSAREDRELTETEITGLTDLGGQLSPLAVGGAVAPAQVSPDHRVALIAVPVAVDPDNTETVATVKQLRKTLAGWPDTLKAEVTGGPAFTTDLTAVFEGADLTLLLATVGVVALLLLVTYRSPILWLVPLLVVAGAEQLTLRIAKLVVPAAGIHLDSGSTTGIASVLVFGAATDYALLLIARYREELRQREDRFAAMLRALRRTAEPVLASGGTVMLAVLSLLLSQRESNRALGVACGVGIVFAMASALVVLPAALVLCGRGVFWPFVPKPGDPPREGRIWGWLGSAAAARPLVVVAGSVGLLAVLASGLLGLRTGLSQTEQFRVKPEAVRAAQTLARAFPAGTTQPATVLTNPRAQDAVLTAVGDIHGVASVKVAEQDQGTVRISVVLTHEPGTPDSDRVLRQMRQAVGRIADSAPPAGSALGGGKKVTSAIVGGTVAADLDKKDADSRDRKLILPLILGLVALVLLVLLRSLVAPVLLVATVIGSFFASFGLGWLAFDHLLGYPAVDPDVVLLAFVFLVALGVDYNIFLVTRAKEDASRLGTGPGMASALRVTGGVITSAGILLAAVFAVLGVLPLLALTQIGVIVGIGVLLDTLLVRTVLVPALAFWLGDRFWWPWKPEVGYLE